MALFANKSKFNNTILRHLDEATIDRLLAGMTDKRLPIAVKIAAVPQEIRGYGFIKDKAVEDARAAEAKLWEQWEAA